MTTYADIEAVNWSSLKHMSVSPLHYQHRLKNPQPSSAAMRMGTAIHCALLEPERFRDTYLVEPDFGKTKAELALRAAWLVGLADNDHVALPLFNLRSKAGKDDLDRWTNDVPSHMTIVAGDEDAAAILPDRKIVTASDLAIVEACAEAVRAHPAAGRMLEAGRAEEAVVWNDAETGVRCKARMDFIGPTFVRELKSTRHGTLRQIYADAARLLYHGGISWYGDGAVTAGLISGDELPRMIFVQTQPPHDVVVARVGELALERGRMLYRTLLRRLVECRAADWWPGIAPGETDLALPGWAASGEDEPEEDW
jgi:exodeoxyribonuclease VIII